METKIATTPVNIPVENKDMIKRYLIGTKVTLGDFYAEAAKEKMEREIIQQALKTLETKKGPY